MWRDALAAGVLGARRALADLLVAQGDIEGATELWREAVREGKPPARRELAQLLHRTGRVREAQHEWYAAITAGDPYARHGLYRLLREEGLHDRAVDLLRNGVRHPLDDRLGLEPGAERPAAVEEAALGGAVFSEPAAALGLAAACRTPAGPRRTASGPGPTAEPDGVDGSDRSGAAAGPARRPAPWHHRPDSGRPGDPGRKWDGPQATRAR
ncbi:hypothetical protein Asp14428_37050 [Actinoplanes sp. NBRC 14428]|nr:hypothetical protein Asp14428_37050 [Actinoplanes sp. NBRC 14428]